MHAYLLPYIERLTNKPNQARFNTKITYFVWAPKMSLHFKTFYYINQIIFWVEDAWMLRLNLKKPSITFHCPKINKQFPFNVNNIYSRETVRLEDRLNPTTGEREKIWSYRWNTIHNGLTFLLSIILTN